MERNTFGCSTGIILSGSPGKQAFETVDETYDVLGWLHPRACAVKQVSQKTHLEMEAAVLLSQT